MLAIDTSTVASVSRSARSTECSRGRGGRRGDGRAAAPRRAARARDRADSPASPTSPCASSRPIAVGIGPGHVHRPPRRRDDGEGDGPGAARPGGPDPEPRSRRVPVAVHGRTGRDPRRSMPAARSCTTRATGPCPAACSGNRSTSSAKPPRSRRRASTPAGERSCSRATARCGYASEFDAQRPVRARGPRIRRSEPVRAGGARDRSASSARISVRPQTWYRCTCGAATPRSRGTGGRRSGTAQPATRRPRRARRRHASPAPAGGAAHRGAGVPAAVDHVALPERARAAVEPRVLRGARRSRRRRLRRPDDDARRRPRHDDRGRPRWQRHKIGTRLLLALAREGDRARRDRPHARGAAVEPRRAGAVPALRVRAGRRAQGLLRRDRRRTR